jgi:hypothetical protein
MGGQAIIKITDRRTIMCRLILLSLTAFLLLGGCSSEKKPNAANFTKAINQYLAKHGQECTYSAQTFPIDVPASELKLQSGTAPQMGALGASAPRPVRRYVLTDKGRKYFQMKPGTFGQSSAFCYGQEQVDSIVKWDEPAAQDGTSITEVTYTYKFQQLADWAKQPEVEQAFPAIKSTLDQAGTNQVVEVHLTNQGWEAGA